MTANPYKPNTIAHHKFGAFMGRYENGADAALHARVIELRAEAKNFCRHGWKAMMDFDFEADCIEAILGDR